VTEYKENPRKPHGEDVLGRIRIILVEPSHPGNIGSVARAMKVMGLTRLTLVRPAHFPHPDASALASGAEDLLAQAQVVDSLSHAIADCHWVYGTSARDRHIAWPMLEAREAAQEMFQRGKEQEIALLFGRERTGLRNEELDHCQTLVQIPTGSLYHSLNLAQAVQILCYELLMASRGPTQLPDPEETSAPASAAEREGFYGQLEEVLRASGFLQEERSEQMMRRLRRIYDRCQASSNEIHILRGTLTEIQRWATRQQGEARG